MSRPSILDGPEAERDWARSLIDDISADRLAWDPSMVLYHV
jgi:hypothetical protein